MSSRTREEADRSLWGYCLLSDRVYWVWVHATSTTTTYRICGHAPEEQRR